MTGLPIQPDASADQKQLIKHYRIRKELVWLFSLGLLATLLYPIYDGIKHANWPPHDATHPQAIKALNCDWKKFSIQKGMLEPDTYASEHSVGTDRKIFFEQPQCASSTYLRFEGSGVRIIENIYDMETKYRTAKIEITFEKN